MAFPASSSRFYVFIVSLLLILLLLLLVRRAPNERTEGARAGAVVEEWPKKMWMLAGAQGREGGNTVRYVNRETLHCTSEADQKKKYISLKT